MYMYMYIYTGPWALRAMAHAFSDFGWFSQARRQLVSGRHICTQHVELVVFERLLVHCAGAPEKKRLLEHFRL